MTNPKCKSILSRVFILIVAIVFGLGLAFFATQNTNPVTITLANTPVHDTPLWIIVIVSLLTGLVMASVFNVFNIMTSMFKLHGKDSAIKGADKKIVNLKNENENLKVENADLKSKKASE